MPNMTNTLTANITATEDTTQNVIINRSIGTLFDASASQIVEYASLAAGPTPISLATAICTQFYLKNIDPNGHTVTVTWTPQGGASAVVQTLLPGDLILFWSKPGGANNGITALSLTPSAATTLIEYFFGG